MIKLGSKGDEVKNVQDRLNEHGFGPLKLDGDFGPVTESAVKRFQRASGLSVDGIVGPNTKRHLDKPPAPVSLINVEEKINKLLAAMENKGYEVHEDGKINTIGVRSPTIESNAFDDLIYLLWKKDGVWILKEYKATTDPGIFWLANPSRVEGTAILVPGQYNSHKLGKHQGRYDALVQHVNKVSVWRDSNRNAILDRSGTIYKGYFGINIHHAGKSSTQVNKWSAGCQVFARISDWNEAMAYWKNANQEVYTYTLLDEDDFK